MFNQKLDQQLGARGTAVVWEIGTSSAYCINSSHGRGSQILYEDIGFRPPVSLLKQGIERRGYVEEEIEAIVDYPADYILITGIPSNLAAKKKMNRLFRSETWMNAGICRALMNSPRIIFGDEPTGALNSKSAQEIMDIFSEIDAEGTAAMLVTHDAKVATEKS